MKGRNIRGECTRMVFGALKQQLLRAAASLLLLLLEWAIECQ